MFITKVHKKTRRRFLHIIRVLIFNLWIFEDYKHTNKFLLSNTCMELFFVLYLSLDFSGLWETRYFRTDGYLTVAF